MAKISKKVIIISIVIFLVLIGGVLFVLNGSKNTDNSWKFETNTGKIETGEGKNKIDVEDKKLQDEANNFELDEALVVALKSYKENKGKNLWDYDHLMWIYIDKGGYDNVIDLGKKAIILFKEDKVTDNTIKHNIVSSMIQAYLYTGKLNEAEILINEYKDISFLFEKVILEYKKGNYDYIISNYDNIKKEGSAYIGFELDLMAKSYVKKGDIEKAIKTYEEIYDFGKGIKNEDVILETFYGYISTSNLKDLYLKQGNTQKSDLYKGEFTSYKNRIDNEETLKDSSGDVKINKKNIYFAINRFNGL